MVTLASLYKACLMTSRKRILSTAKSTTLPHNITKKYQNGPQNVVTIIVPAHSLSTNAISCSSTFYGSISSTSTDSNRFINYPAQSSILSIPKIMTNDANHNWYKITKRSTSTGNRATSFKTNNFVNDEYHNSDARSESKLLTLTKMKTMTDEAKKLYLLQNVSNDNKESTDEGINNGTDNDNCLESTTSTYDNWIEHETKLSDAFSKAIKYTARLRSKDAALQSKLLLDEMISRHGISSESSLFTTKIRHQEGYDIIIHDDAISNFLKQICFDGDDDNKDQSNARIEITDIYNKNHRESNILSEAIPPPSKRDYHNVLHSWASSKAKRKGLQAEILLLRMIELATIYPNYFDFPDSRTFALVIKCYAGSTYNQATERIRKIHSYHEVLATYENTPLVKDDPYLLMHSIKSIKHFKNNKILEEWTQRLHSFVLDKSNATQLNNNDDDDGIYSQKSWKNEKIDVTGTYTSVLRGFVREGQVDSAIKVLQQMHEIQNYNRDIKIDNFSSPATIDIRTNAYNLVLGSCKAKKDLPLAMNLLNQMIESIQVSEGDKLATSIPLPNNQSFVMVMRALSSMPDMNAAQTIAENFLFQFEENVKAHKIDASSDVHNAYIDLLISRFGHKNDLLSTCNAVVNRMYKSSGKVKPDTNTWNLLLKACVTNCREEDFPSRLQTAKEMFNNMKTGVKGSLTDKSFQYMMQCSSLIDDEEERKEEIKNLFQMASSLGFVSADVLKLLKQNISEKEFLGIVGNGRLADKWLANVTSKTVKYTDFTNGGANKHARRKGKSTSNWAKKQRKRVAVLQARKQNKVEKRNQRKAQL